MEKTALPYHGLSADDALRRLETGHNGLSQADAAARLEAVGRNTLPKGDQLTAVGLLLRQFANPLAYILLFAMMLSFVMKHYSDGVIIALVVFVTGLVGFIQEFKANRALRELNSIIAYRARVLRGGVLVVVDQADIVPGDLIDMCPGDIIPADARLIEAHDLRVSEAVLTGEPAPSKKFIAALPADTPLADRDNMVFQGTHVSEGAGKAVVVATGARTEMGKIASLIKDTEDVVTPLQKQIVSFGKWLSLFLIAANVAIFLIGIWSGRPFFEMFMISVVVVVSAVPEGLAPAMSIVLALGMQRLIKKQGLVRKIISAETLGAVSVICTDKTGTLTEGEMSMESIVTGAGTTAIGGPADPHDLEFGAATALKICVLANDAVVDTSAPSGGACLVGNTTDKSMLAAGALYGIDREVLERAEKRINELPFSSETKLMATLHDGGGRGNTAYVKGAPEKILPLAGKILSGRDETDLDGENRADWYRAVDGLTAAGQRVVAVAYKRTEEQSLAPEDLDGLVFVALVVIKDKIRNDAKEAIGLCRRAGVKVVMITGDHANTALAIANEVGIGATPGQVVSGNELDELDDELLSRKVRNALVFARVEPRHKLKIVELLQKSGEVVAMTGDGVNDAPALKKADIGVAMGNGTDVAKEVADLVLLNNSFMTIVEAIRQGRTTFMNIRKVVVYLFTDCFQEMVVIGTAVLAGWPLPILPVQILWIKLVESPLPATSLSFEEAGHDVLSDRPRGRKAPLLTRRLNFNIAFYAVLMDVIALSFFYHYWQSTGDLDKARTLLFVALGMSTLFNIYNIRTLGHSVFRVNPFKNKFLTAATVVGFLLFLLAVYSETMNKILHTVPLARSDWAAVFAYAFASLLVFEAGKWFRRYKI